MNNKFRNRKIHHSTRRKYRHLRAYALSLISENSSFAMKHAENLPYRYFCLENGIEMEDDKIVNYTPSASTHRNIIRESTALFCMKTYKIKKILLLG